MPTVPTGRDAAPPAPDDLAATVAALPSAPLGDAAGALAAAAERRMAITACHLAVAEFPGKVREHLSAYHAARRDICVVIVDSRLTPVERVVSFAKELLHAHDPERLPAIAKGDDRVVDLALMQALTAAVDCAEEARS